MREPRKQLLVLRCLSSRGRATPPPGLLRRLFTDQFCVPKEIFWCVLQYWRCDRDLEDRDYGPEINALVRG